MVTAARGIKAGVNGNNKAVIIKYYKDLLFNLIALIPKLSEYPTIEPILLLNIVVVFGLIRRLSLGTASIQDVNESNRIFATILEKAIPK